MNNFIMYFYNMNIDKINNIGKYYQFYYNNNSYKLYMITENINIDNLIEINNKLLSNTLVSEIIYNKDNQIISTINGINYILIKIYINENKDITLEEINYLANSIYKEKLNINYATMWSNKIDYLEELINENGKKYPIIVDSFNYFVGLAENAISYFNNIKIDENYKYGIGHKIIRFDDKIDVLYNPLNIIYDYRVRDIAEYIKNSFFNENKLIIKELENYIKNNNLSLMEVNILISRLLYPSFYFELYEDILIDNKDESIINNLISKTDEYEKYLNMIISFFKKYYNIEEILWLKKRRI